MHNPVCTQAQTFLAQVSPYLAFRRSISYTRKQCLFHIAQAFSLPTVGQTLPLHDRRPLHVAARKLLNELKGARAKSPEGLINLGDVPSMRYNAHGQLPRSPSAQCSPAVDQDSDVLQARDSSIKRSPSGTKPSPSNKRSPNPQAPVVAAPLPRDAPRSPTLKAPAADAGSPLELLRLSRTVLQDVKEGQSRWLQLTQVAPDQEDHLGGRSSSSSAGRAAQLISPANILDPYFAQAEVPSSPDNVPQLAARQRAKCTVAQRLLGQRPQSASRPSQVDASVWGGYGAQQRYAVALEALRDADQALPPEKRKANMRIEATPLHADERVLSGSSASALVRTHTLLPSATLSHVGITRASGGSVALSPATAATLSLEEEAERVLKRLADASVAALHAAAAQRPAAAVAAAAAQPLSELEVKVAMAQLLAGASAAAQAREEQQWELQRQRQLQEQRMALNAGCGVDSEGEDDGHGAGSNDKECSWLRLRAQLMLRLWRRAARASVIRQEQYECSATCFRYE